MAEQLHLDFAPPTVIPRADGSYVVRPGAPVPHLTAQQFGDRVGLNRDSVYRYIAAGDIPQEDVVYAGQRKLWIKSSAVPAFLERWRKKRAG